MLKKLYIYLHMNYLVTTDFVIYMTIIRVKKIGYGLIMTWSEPNSEYISKEKQYYLNSTEYTFSATNSEYINACVHGWALDLFLFQCLKRRIIFLIDYFQ